MGILKNGESALHAATLLNQLLVVKVLMLAGADPELKNKAGFTSLQLAKRSQNKYMVEYLQNAVDRKAMIQKNND